MIQLRYGNTNTFLIPADPGWLLVDTDYAGRLPAFYKALKQCGVRTADIRWILATHYHPDHMGLIPELMKQGARLLLMQTQMEHVHDSDYIFARDGLPFEPIDETRVKVIRCEESREFLAGIGIAGEIIATPSHSEDSVSLILDDGDCFVGDLEPAAYLEIYEDNKALRADWDVILRFQPKQIHYAHISAKK